MVSALLTFSAKHIAALDEAIRAASEANDRAATRRDVAELIPEALALPDLLRRAYEAVTARLQEMNWPYSIANEVRETLRLAFAQGVDVLARAQREAEQAAAAGAAVPEAARLPQALAKVQEMQDIIFRGWTPFTLEDYAQALEAIKRGDFGTLESP